MRPKLKNKREIADAWTMLNPVAEAHGIEIGSNSHGSTTKFFCFEKANPQNRIETSHFGGLWDFNVVGWYAACEHFVHRHAIQAAWNLRQHKGAISRAYEALCTLGEATSMGCPLDNGSALQCDIILNPSDKESGREIIATPDGLVELHAQNVPTIGGKPSRRWNYTVVTVHGGGAGHDDPPPAVDESKPLSLDAAVRAFATAVITNKITFANLNL